jgi:hypothetical protein
VRQMRLGCSIPRLNSASKVPEIATPVSHLHIHIGGKKTGSTTLQSYLRQHSGELKEQGILVPHAQGETEDKWLTQNYIGERRRSAASRLRRFFDTWNSFSSQGGCSALVSAESLSDLYPEEIDRLKTDLDEFFDSYTIVLYIRRQDRVAVSHYSTLLRGGGVSGGLMSEGLGKRKRRAISYGSIIKDWSAAFSSGNVVVRKYLERWQGDWDVVDDFLAVLGIRDRLSRLPIAGRNLALCGEAAAYLRKYNQMVRNGRQSSSPKVRQQLIAALEQLPGDEPIPRPERKKARSFYRSFDDENELVRKLYFPGDESLFDEQFDMYPERGRSIDSLLTDEYSRRLDEILLGGNCPELRNAGTRIRRWAETQ